MSTNTEQTQRSIRAERRSVAKESNQSVSPPEEHVSFYWIFFNRTHTPPLDIDIPRQLFNGKSQECLQLFVEALRKYYGLNVQPGAVEFWVPRERLSYNKAPRNGWPTTISDFETAFQKVRRRTSLATALAGQQLEDDDAVHLIVTVGDPYVQLDNVQADEMEERDVVGPLPENTRFMETLSDIGPSPSQGSKSTEYANAQGKRKKVIYDGRWAKSDVSTVAPPIQIFHPIFETFVHDASGSHIKPTRDDVIATQKLMHVASRITDEGSRATEMRRILSIILEVAILQQQNSDRDTSTPDGMVTVMLNGISIVLLIWELKRELGEGGSDASTQGELAMRRVWTDKVRTNLVKKCCCPTLILAGGGPWLTVLGGVFTDKLIVQRLTDMMWIGHSSTHDEPRVYRLARVLVALRHNLHRLKDYYTRVNSSSIPAFDISLPHPRNYPYLKSFVDSKTGKTLRFEYVRALENDARCVTYQAKILSSADSLDANASTDNDAPTDIVVKFVSRYGKDVHEFLARDNHAPDLRYFGAPLVQDKEDILGDGSEPSTEAPNSLSPEQPSLALPLCPMKMVVMDYVSPHAKPWPRNAREQVSNVLHKLHDGGYVFGDLRPPNVLFDQSNKVKFIDFDWSGLYNPSPPDKTLQAQSRYTHYPLNLSKSIAWADGTGDLLPILPDHDWQMLEHLPFDES